MHSADDWDELLVTEIERQQAEGKRVAFRADAAFAKPEIYDALEQRDVEYAICMPANQLVDDRNSLIERVIETGRIGIDSCLLAP